MGERETFEIKLYPSRLEMFLRLKGARILAAAFRPSTSLASSRLPPHLKQVRRMGYSSESSL